MSDRHAQRAKIIEKVRALLTMTVANGCTEAEAMTAATMAAKLMEEYDLAITDVRSIYDQRIARESKPFSSAEQPRQMHAAGIYVAVTIGEFFDCKCWRNHTEIVFFGLKEDVELAHIMLGMIRFAMDHELGDYLKSGKPRGEHHWSVVASFSKGMGHRICERLRQLKFQRTANVRAKGKDLVILKGQLVDEAYAKFFGAPLKKGRPSKPSKSALAYAAGVAAGDRVDIGERPEIEKPAEKPVRRRKEYVEADDPSQLVGQRNKDAGMRSFLWRVPETIGGAFRSVFGMRIVGLRPSARPHL
jgi:hypothetical protein